MNQPEPPDGRRVRQGRRNPILGRRRRKKDEDVREGKELWGKKNSLHVIAQSLMTVTKKSQGGTFIGKKGGFPSKANKKNGVRIRRKKVI